MVRGGVASGVSGTGRREGDGGEGRDGQRQEGRGWTKRYEGAIGRIGSGPARRATAKRTTNHSMPMQWQQEPLAGADLSDWRSALVCLPTCRSWALYACPTKLVSRRWPNSLPLFYTHTLNHTHTRGHRAMVQEHWRQTGLKRGHCRRQARIDTKQQQHMDAPRERAACSSWWVHTSGKGAQVCIPALRSLRLHRLFPLAVSLHLLVLHQQRGADASSADANGSRCSGRMARRSKCQTRSLQSVGSRGAL